MKICREGTHRTDRSECYLFGQYSGSWELLSVFQSCTAERTKTAQAIETFPFLTDVYEDM